MQTTFFNYDSTEPRPEHVEENTIFNYRCRPKTQDHSTYDSRGGI